MILGLYWRRTTKYGALAAMVGGFVSCLAFYSPSWFERARLDFAGIRPAIWGMTISFAIGIGVSLMSKPAEHLVERYFD